MLVGKCVGGVRTPACDSACCPWSSITWPLDKLLQWWLKTRSSLLPNSLLSLPKKRDCLVPVFTSRKSVHGPRAPTQTGLLPACGNSKTSLAFKQLLGCCNHRKWNSTTGQWQVVSFGWNLKQQGPYGEGIIFKWLKCLICITYSSCSYLHPVGVIWIFEYLMPD